MKDSVGQVVEKASDIISSGSPSVFTFSYAACSWTGAEAGGISLQPTRRCSLICPLRSSPNSSSSTASSLGKEAGSGANRRSTASEGAVERVSQAANTASQTYGARASGEQTESIIGKGEVTIQIERISPKTVHMLRQVWTEARDSLACKVVSLLYQLM